MSIVKYTQQSSLISHYINIFALLRCTELIRTPASGTLHVHVCNLSYLLMWDTKSHNKRGCGGRTMM